MVAGGFQETLFKIVPGPGSEIAVDNFQEAIVMHFQLDTQQIVQETSRNNVKRFSGPGSKVAPGSLQE